MSARVDVLVPVYNSMHVVRPCLESVCAFTDFDVDRVTVLDDGSDSYSATAVEEIAAERPGLSVRHAERNLGFVRNCNWGMEAADAEFVLLLNSDTVVTPGWLDKIVAAMRSDPAIGIASPISNFAPHMRIEMIPGTDPFRMNELVEELSDVKYPDITTPEGFCYVMRADCLADIGYFDPVFDDGYGEESDLAMRANAAGWRTVCVDDTYIYHRGRATFGDATRDARYDANKQIFFARWGDRYARDFTDMQQRDPLGPLRRRIDELRAVAGPPALGHQR